MESWQDARDRLKGQVVEQTSGNGKEYCDTAGLCSSHETYDVRDLFRSIDECLRNGESGVDRGTNTHSNECGETVNI